MACSGRLGRRTSWCRAGRPQVAWVSDCRAQDSCSQGILRLRYGCSNGKAPSPDLWILHNMRSVYMQYFALGFRVFATVLLASYSRWHLLRSVFCKMSCKLAGWNLAPAAGSTPQPLAPILCTMKKTIMLCTLRGHRHIHQESTKMLQLRWATVRAMRKGRAASAPQLEPLPKMGAGLAD